MKILLAVACLVSGGTLLFAEKPSAGDDQAIRAAVGAFGEAFNHHDAAAIGQLWAEDGDRYIASNNSFLRGREAARKHHEKFFAGTLKDATLRQTVESVRVVSPGVAIVDVRTEMTDANPLHQSKSVSMVTEVLVRRDGKWLIESYRSMPTK